MRQCNIENCQVCANPPPLCCTGQAVALCCDGSTCFLRMQRWRELHPLHDLRVTSTEWRRTI